MLKSGLAEATASVTEGTLLGQGTAAAHGELACEVGDDEASTALEQQGAGDDEPRRIWARWLVWGQIEARGGEIGLRLQ